MNQHQIILLVFIILGIYFLLNLKFKVQQFFNTALTQTCNTAKKPTKNSTKKMSMFGPKAFYIASGLIGFIAFLLLLISLNIINTWYVQYNLAEQSTNWFPLEAIVTEKGRQGRTSRRNKSSSSMYYGDNVYYTFQYKGKRLKGQRLSYDNAWSTSSASTEGDLLKSIPRTGTKTTIYYNEETGESVMFPGRQHTKYLALIITIPFFILGVVISFFSLYVFLIGISTKQ